jgi:GTP cyclohydrolase IA
MKPTKEDAKKAVRTLLEYIGEDPNREGLLKTPDRVIASYEESFAGYEQNIEDILKTRFSQGCDFRDLVLLQDIEFTSYCEHHLLPIPGSVDIAYIPNKSIVGISKLARLVDAFAKRLQVQEKMTMQIAESLQENLSPLGVAVRVNASHSCMTIRGVMKKDSIMQTVHYTGAFATESKYRLEFFNLISRGR